VNARSEASTLRLLLATGERVSLRQLLSRPETNLKLWLQVRAFRERRRGRRSLSFFPRSPWRNQACPTIPMPLSDPSMS
jgi:hypothetical protein